MENFWPRWEKIGEAYQKKIAAESALYPIICDSDIQEFWESRSELTTKYKKIRYGGMTEVLKEFGMNDTTIEHLLNNPDLLESRLQGIQEEKEKLLAKPLPWDAILKGKNVNSADISEAAMEKGRQIVEIIKQAQLQ